MSKIVLYDALSYLRVRLETEKPGDFLRGVINETANHYGTRIWVWDGAGGNKARRDLFPAYKTKREYKPDIIRATDFVRELMELSGAYQLRVPGFEGDDVIAALVVHFLNTTDLPIEIQCRDADLAALCDLSPRVKCMHTVKIPFKDIRLYKVTVGDPSDCIPGIKGFGEKSWAECDREGLRRLVSHVTSGGGQPLQEVDEARALAIGLSKASYRWLCERENATQLAIMKRIIDPLPVSKALIDQHLTGGKPNYEAMQRKMQEFML